MSSPAIERLRGQNEMWQQISKQLKEAREFENRITLKKGGEIMPGGISGLYPSLDAQKKREAEEKENENNRT